MKILVATKKTQGQRKNDFSHAEEGEPVRFGFVCDGAKVDDRCGCKRAMIGMRSHKGTTTITVVEMDIDLAAEITKSLTEAWGTAPEAADVARDVRELTRIAAAFPVGMVFEIRGAKMQERRVVAQAGVAA